MKTAIRMKHPLRSTGTHQTARLLRAIAPGHFRLDERSMQDLITAAHSYARMLTYVGPGGQADGDWTAFWEVENLTYMAVLAAIDTDQLRKGYEDIDLAFGQALLEQEGKSKKSKKNAAKDPISPDFFRQLLGYLRDMAAGLEKHYTTLRPEIPLKDLLLTFIRRDNHFPYEPDNVDSALQQLVAFHKAADDHLDAEIYKTFCQSDARWGIRNRDEYDCILPDETLDREKVRGLFVQFFNILMTLKARAQQMFDAEVALLELSEETLERRLEPHIALFITFLQLFRHAQEGMNDLSGRHLDFYYNSVLCLERRPADPDHAYLIFTLAKEFNEEVVEKGTLLLAGKDKNGRPIQFETLERWKVTKASIEEIRNTCIAPNFINASTISQKGIPPEKAFRAFGDDATAPEGELGFAIASPQLFLQEGRREVEVRLELAGKIEYANVFATNIKVAYSMGEEYFSLRKLSFDETGNGFVLNPLVAPFLPLQSIEPARRIVSEAMSDLCQKTPSNTVGSDAIEKAVIEIYARMDSATGTVPSSSTDLQAFLQKNIFYPALSGVNLIKKVIEGELKKPTPSGKYLAELYFYRAYYQWALASVFAPPLQAGTVATLIPDLLNYNLPADAEPTHLYELNKMYDDIKKDLFLALSNLAGKPIVEANLEQLTPALIDTTATDSNTSVNIYTVCAFLSRIYLHTGDWDFCIKTADIVISSSKYLHTYDPVGGEDREATAKRLLNDTFDNVGGSSEVIWAMDASISQSIQNTPETPSYLFSFLGVRDVFGPSTKKYFEESSLLNEVNKQNLRYDERFLAGSNPLPTSSLHDDTNHYDYRDNQYFENSGNTSSWFSNKYFRNNKTLVPMLRLAEVYLNKAWCLVQKDTDNAEARRLVNALRVRAGALQFAKTETDKPVYEVDSIQEFHIEEERVRELSFEGDRRDFVRIARSGLADRSFTVLSVPPAMTSGIPQPQLPPGETTILLPPVAPTGSNSATTLKLQWDSKWLYFEDALPAAINKEEIKTSEPSVLSLKLTLKEDAPPFVPDQKLVKAGITPYPVLKVSFSGEIGQGGTGFYNFLKKQTIKEATIKVTVTGIQKSLVLQNDFGLFDGTQRFYPFGPVPENSARFLLGCQEAFTKKLDSATVTFDWVEEEGISKGEKGYNAIYQNYKIDAVTTPSPGKPAENYFPQPKVTIDLLKDAEFILLFPKLATGETKTNQGSMIVIPESKTEDGKNIVVETPSTINADLTVKNRMRRAFPIQLQDKLERVISTEQVTKYSSTQKRGFLRFKLEGDFGHKTFPNLITRAANKEPGVNIPNEPYTPATNSVSLSYVSTQEMEDVIDQFFHILPFEGGMHPAVFGTGETSLVYGYPSPVQEPSTGGFYPANLFLGMAKLVPGDNLALLFQTSEGSELEPDSRPPKVHWMYLTEKNEWVEFPAQKILRDTTHGLTRSGIVQLATPNNITSAGNTMLNPTLLWLRVSVVEHETAPEKVAAFPALLDIRAQAIEARFLPIEGNDLERLDSPLPAQSISGLSESSSAIKKAEQPYASFGGRKPENEGSSEYHRRVSERLRHKDRAITAWDYERLLLEQYPLAAIAKCIPHTRYEDTEGFAGATELAPGFVTIAVVPDLVRRPNMVRTEPRFSRGDLEEMRDYLVPKANAFVQSVENKATDKRTDYLQVVNPQYEAVSVAVRVWLVRGADQNLAKYQLDQALQHFFSPWLTDPERLPQFGRIVRRSQLIQMIEQLDYVDAIEDLTVTDYTGKIIAGASISPGTARSILTTTAVHNIEIATGVGGQGGPAPRAALAPPDFDFESAEASETPNPTPEIREPQPTAQRKTSKRK